MPPPLWDYFDEELRNFSRDSRRNDTKNSSVPTKIMVLDVAISTCIIVQLSGLVMIDSISLKSRFGEKLWFNGACMALQLKRCAASSVFCRFISIGLMQSQLLNCIVRIFVGIFILVNGRALTVLLGSSSSLLHGTYSIFYRKDSIQYIYYMLATLMRMPSTRPANIINTIQFAWHNNNFIMQNMHLKKPNFNHVRKPKHS